MNLKNKFKKALAKWLFTYLMDLLPKPDKTCMPDIPYPNAPIFKENNIIKLSNIVHASDYDIYTGRAKSMIEKGKRELSIKSMEYIEINEERFIKHANYQNCFTLSLYIKQKASN